MIILLLEREFIKYYEELTKERKDFIERLYNLKRIKEIKSIEISINNRRN